MDKRSLTDAYVQVDYGGKKHKTKTVKDNLNPTWEETFTFPFSGAQDVVFKVYDDDPLLDDFIGQCMLSFSQATQEDWLPLSNKKGQPAGHLLVHVSGPSEGSAERAPTHKIKPYDRYDPFETSDRRDKYPNKYDRLYDRYAAKWFHEGRPGFHNIGAPEPPQYNQYDTVSHIPPHIYGYGNMWQAQEPYERSSLPWNARNQPPQHAGYPYSSSQTYSMGPPYSVPNDSYAPYASAHTLPPHQHRLLHHQSRQQPGGYRSGQYDTMGYLPPYADDEYSGYTAQEYGPYPYGFRQ